MALRLITAPAGYPITLAEAKAHLRVDHDDEDANIELCIRAATAYVDGPYGFLARVLITQTWELVLDEFPINEIKIPLPPLQEIVSVKYDDGDGVEQTVDPADYTVDNASEPGWIVPVTTGWPSTFDGINAVRVRFICGYEDDAGDSPDYLAGNVPSDIRAAMLMHIGALYAHRETIVVGQVVAMLPGGVEYLLRPYRMHLGMA